MKIDSLREAFGARPFSAREAAVALGTDKATASATLRRLKVAGHLDRIDRGTYRVAEPAERVRVAKRHRELLREKVLAAPLRIALDGPDAVRRWTGGRYVVGSPPGHDLLYLAVDASDADDLRILLDEEGIAHGSEDDWPSGDGLKVIVREVEGLEIAEHDGEWVITRDAVLEMIRDRPGAYEGAEEWVHDA